MIDADFDIRQNSDKVSTGIDRPASKVLEVLSVSTIRSVDVFFSVYVKEPVNS